LDITFIDAARMRGLNRRSLGHDWTTDVLCFRYDLPAPRSRRFARSQQAGVEPVAGDILIAPLAARRYAKTHGLAYRDEMARYVVHGILHWTGRDDRTAAQRRTMRRMEDELLARCTP